MGCDGQCSGQADRDEVGVGSDGQYMYTWLYSMTRGEWAVNALLTEGGGGQSGVRWAFLALLMGGVRQCQLQNEHQGSQARHTCSQFLLFP